MKKKIVLAVIAMAILAIAVTELRWRSDAAKSTLVKSPSGRYVAEVRILWVGDDFWSSGIAVGREVFVFRDWMPLKSVDAARAVVAYCSVKVMWKNDDELEVSCPSPEGVPQVTSPVKNIKVVFKIE